MVRIPYRISRRLDILESKLRGWSEKNVEYHLRKGGGLEKNEEIIVLSGVALGGIHDEKYGEQSLGEHHKKKYAQMLRCSEETEVLITFNTERRGL